MTGAKVIRGNPISPTTVQKEQQLPVDLELLECSPNSRLYISTMGGLNCCNHLTTTKRTYLKTKPAQKKRGIEIEMVDLGPHDIGEVPTSNHISARFTFFLNQFVFFPYYLHPKESCLTHMVTAKSYNKKSRSTSQHLLSCIRA